MNFRRASVLAGPIDSQPGSSMNASASVRAAPSWWAGVRGSGEPVSGKGRGGVRLRPVGAVDTVAAREPLQLELAAVVEAQAVPVAARGRLPQLVGDQDLPTESL